MPSAWRPSNENEPGPPADIDSDLTLYDLLPSAPPRRTSQRIMNEAKPTESSQNAASYLASFLNRTLHLHTSDGRMFVGLMKCTDPERNIILSMTHEYRQPSPADVKMAAEKHEGEGKTGNVRVDMEKRFVGLVVVPGKYITKIEVED